MASQVIACTKEQFDARVKDIKELNHKLYTSLAELSYAIDGQGNSKSMAATAFATAVAIYTNLCGYEGEALKEILWEAIDDYVLPTEEDLEREAKAEEALKKHLDELSVKLDKRRESDTVKG